MVKKISALVIALVLCLSVVVVPASAEVELGSAQIAFSLEWDKAAYSAGETATLSVYMDAEDSLSLFTGSLVIGLNSAVISQADNDIDTVRANATTSDVFRSYYKGTDTQLTWLASTVAPKVTAANTAEEQALYDHYLKYTVTKDNYGSHDNCATNKAGFNGTDFDPSEPIFTVSFVVAEGVEDGTAINAAITSGSLTCTPVQTTWKYYKSPGTATTTANIAATGFDVSQAVAGAVVGEETVASIVNPLRDGQIRFHKNGTAYAGSFDVRALAVISGADFDATFRDIATAKTMISEIGFVFAQGATVTAPSMDDVKDVIASCANGEGKNGYLKKTVNYISTSVDEGNYVFSCIATDIPDAEKNNSLVAVGYIAYTVDGETVYAYYPAAQTISFAGLFNTHYADAFGA